MKKCAKCGEEFPDYFPECPSCGHQAEKNKQKSSIGTWIRVVVYGGIFFVVASTALTVAFSDKKTNYKSVNTSVDAKKSEPIKDYKQSSIKNKDPYADCIVLFDAPYTSKKETIEKLSDIVSADDSVAFKKILSLPGNGLLKKNLHVQVEHMGMSFAKVRIIGSIDSIWTIRKAIECNN